MAKSPESRSRPMPTGGRFVLAVFGLVFLGIGLTVIVSLWSEPFGQFGSPPLVFRLFGTFISLAFVAFGSAMAHSAFRRRAPGPSLPTVADVAEDWSRSSAAPANFTCPQCGAPLEGGQAVSPHGDARCAHCDSWFNIHGQ